MNVKEAASGVIDAAKSVSQKVADSAGKAVDFVREKTGLEKGKDFGLLGVREHMDVVGTCGMAVGRVDRVEGNAIKLTRSDSGDGKHHFIPGHWVEKVDDKVHLSKSVAECRAGWKTEASAYGC